MAANEAISAMSLCRVCLASDRITYQVEDTMLEQTYYRITTDMLQRQNWPATLCCICLSQLRRCRTFMETAREANAALDQWFQSQAECKLPERPLLSLGSYRDMFEYIPEDSQIEEVTQNRVKRKWKEEHAGTRQNEITYCEGIKHEIPLDPSQFLYDEDNEYSENTKSDQTYMLPDFESVHLPAEMPSDVNSDRPNVRDSKTPGTSGRDTVRSRRKAKLKDESKVCDSAKKHQAKSRGRPVKNTQPKQSSKSDTKIKRPYVKSNGIKQIYSCDKCDYKSDRKRNFQMHIMNHTGEKPYACDKCDYRCTAKCSLKLHTMMHTGEKPFACNICDYRCNLKQKLKEHQMTHTGEKRFMCDKCDYRCIGKNHLKRHLMTHTGQKPYACNLCDYKCNVKSNLRQHLTTHTGAKMFACDKCDYKSNQKVNLKTHSMIHDGIKPYSCDMCDYKCIGKSTLKRHMLIHSGEKPFACDKCDYKCIRKMYLKRHLLTHSGESFN